MSVNLLSPEDTLSEDGWDTEAENLTETEEADIEDIHPHPNRASKGETQNRARVVTGSEGCNHVMTGHVINALSVLLRVRPVLSVSALSTKGRGSEMSAYL